MGTNNPIGRDWEWFEFLYQLSCDSDSGRRQICLFVLGMVFLLVMFVILFVIVILVKMIRLFLSVMLFMLFMLFMLCKQLRGSEVRLLTCLVSSFLFEL